MQNEPIFKIIKIMLSHFILKTKPSSLKPVSEKNEPKRSHLTHRVILSEAGIYLNSHLEEIHIFDI